MEPNLDDIKPEKTCRVCLCESDRFKPFNAKLGDKDKTILEAINYVVNIDMKLENGLPDQICHDCEYSLDLADNFKRRCLDSEDILGQEHKSLDVPVTRVYGECSIPVTVEKNHENSLVNSSIKDVVDKLLKKTDDIASYANVTISKKKINKTNFQVDPDEMVMDDDDLDDYENDYEIDDENDYENVKNDNEYAENDYKNVENDGVNVENGSENIENDNEKNENVENYIENVKNDSENGEFLDNTANVNDAVATKDIPTKSNKPALVKSKKSVKVTIKKAKDKKIEIEAVLFICDECGMKFKWKNDLQEHVPKHSIKTSFVCECNECGKVYKSKVSLARHKRVKHTVYGDYNCNICSKKFNMLHTFNSHLHKAHTVKVIKYDYPCEKCNRQFQHKKKLMKHFQLWHVERIHICEVCKMQFSDKATYETHKKVHVPEKMLCPICGRHLFYNQYRNHIRRHENVKRHQCHMCDRAFVLKSSLHIHFRTHTGERKLFNCPICGKAFCTSSGMHVHRRKHSGARPYRCEYCPKAYFQQCILRNHMRTHTGERPFKCPLCESAFTTSKFLLKHVKRHAKDTPPDMVAAAIKTMTKPGRPSFLSKEGAIKESAPVSPTASGNKAPSEPFDEGFESFPVN